MILSGAIEPHKLVREAELARQIDVGRTPVREALKRLSAENILQLSPSGGYVLVQFSNPDLEEIYALRAALEGLAANLAARKMNRVTAAILQDHLEAMEAAIVRKDNRKVAELNSKFHYTIAEASGNKLLLQMILSIQDIFERHRIPAIIDNMRGAESHIEHRQIAEALMNRDAQLAESRIKEHVQRALDVRRHAFRGEPAESTPSSETPRRAAAAKAQPKSAPVKRAHLRKR